MQETSLMLHVLQMLVKVYGLNSHDFLPLLQMETKFYDLLFSSMDD